MWSLWKVLSTGWKESSKNLYMWLQKIRCVCPLHLYFSIKNAHHLKSISNFMCSHVYSLLFDIVPLARALHNDATSWLWITNRCPFHKVWYQCNKETNQKQILRLVMNSVNHHHYDYELNDWCTNKSAGIHLLQMRVCVFASESNKQGTMIKYSFWIWYLY